MQVEHRAEVASSQRLNPRSVLKWRNSTCFSWKQHRSNVNHSKQTVPKRVPEEENLTCHFLHESIDSHICICKFLREVGRGKFKIR